MDKAFSIFELACPPTGLYIIPRSRGEAISKKRKQNKTEPKGANTSYVNLGRHLDIQPNPECQRGDQGHPATLTGKKPFNKPPKSYLSNPHDNT